MSGVKFYPNSKQSLEFYKQENGSFYCQSCDYRRLIKKILIVI